MQGNSDNHLLQVSNQFISIMKSFQASKSWKLKQEEANLTVWEQQLQERMVIKAQTKINLPFDTVLTFFSDPIYMKNLADGNIELFQVVYDNKVVRVVHFIITLPGPISNREFVSVNTVKVEGNRAICGNKSCNYPIKKDPDTVMAEAHATGFILDKIDANTTLLTHFADVDIKGSVPNFIKNTGGSKRAEALGKIQEKIRAYKK